MSHLHNSQTKGSGTASVMPGFAIIAKQKLKESIMLNNTTISALALATAIISTPAQASVNQTTFDNNIAKVNLNITAIEPGYALTKSAARSPEASPFVVAWSIKNVGKKVVKGVKNVGKKVKRNAIRKGKGIKRFGSVSKKLLVGTGRQAGQALRAVNRTYVPSEIRNGASKAYRTAKRGVKRVIKHPYGKRCKPNKYLQPVCSVYPKKRRAITRVIRPTNVHDHRRAKQRRVNVHDHRSATIQGRRR